MRTLCSTVTAWPSSSNIITTQAAPYFRTSRAWARNWSSPSLRLIELTIDLPCTHFSPASSTAQFELSIITGTRATSGSAASRLRNSVITFGPSSRPSSMLTSRMFAPPSTCCRATETASARLPSRTSRANFREPETLVRSPIMVNVLSGRITSGSRPLRSRIVAGRRRTAGRLAAHGLGDRADVGRRRAAAAADDIQPAVAGKLAQHRGHLLRRFVVAAELVGQSGVGMATRPRRAKLRKLFDVGPHQHRAECAVDAHAQQIGMLDRGPERPPASGRRACGRCGR